MPNILNFPGRSSDPRSEHQQEPETAIKVGRSELRTFRLGWTAFVVLATSFPYLLNWFSAPAGYHYTWIIPPYPADSFAYMAWSQQAAHGSLLFQFKYTAQPHPAFLFHPFFLICGWISWFWGCDIGIVHWVMKAVGVVLFFVTLFRYTDYLGLSGFQSIVASLLVGFSSGFGWLLVSLHIAPQSPSSIVPVDLWLVDSNTFWSLLWNPLFPYSLTLLLLTIHWLDRGTRDARKADFWLAGLSAAVLALVHPYSQPLLFALAVTIAILRRRADAIGYLIRYFSVLLPVVLYLLVVSKFQPLVARHSSLGEMKSPNLTAYVLGFGLPLVMFGAGLAMAWASLIKRYWHIVLWFVLSMAFAYLPLWFQRKLVFGAHIPLCIIAGVSFDLILTRYSALSARKRNLAVAAAILLPLLVCTSLHLLLNVSRAAGENAKGTCFISNEMLEGLNTLKKSSQPSEIVFASPATSRLIPAFSGNTVVWGHWAMSIDYEERLKWFADLFLQENSSWGDEQRARKFWAAGIQYIFADGELKDSLERYPWQWKVILSKADKVFANSSVVIYRYRGG